MSHRDTIAAIATAAPGAIGILRLSGPLAISALSALFTSVSGGKLEEKAPRTLVYGSLCDSDGEIIDWVLATYTRGPNSYTGEDTAEVHCHGSPLVQTLALEALFGQGCRQAQAGEFTQRGFLNGKLDLSQAEAVADLIDAQSREGARHAAGQLAGALGRRIATCYSDLVDLMAHFCVVLDYPDEDLDAFNSESISHTLATQEQVLTDLLATWSRGKYLRDGIPCAIIGRPNAGKSSLLNALLGYERAIVTPIAGTTRDTVEERATLGGIALRLIDTAGLRESDDPIEQMGVARSRAAVERAQLILLLSDCTTPLSQEDILLLEQCKKQAPTVLLRTKGDLSPVPVGIELGDTKIVTLSALTGEGIPKLEDAVGSLFPRGTTERYGELLTNARQAEATTRALEALKRAREALEMGVTPDALLTDVEEAMGALGELTGQSVREDITSRIFQRFCVGK